MKKFLSLVLALVMTMSLVTVGAGAAEYKDLTDKSEIQYEEAVAVLNKIGIITGYEDGSFKPTGALTRGAAAKIIVSLMIGSEAASNLTVTAAPYSDVPVTNTFAAVISYCKTAGYINGYADGTFRPTAPLTGYAFTKMLLGALGYDGKIEGFTGSGWTMNVAKLGNKAGLFNDFATAFKGNNGINREEACLLALNTLKATEVEYAGTDVSVKGDNIDVTVGNTQYSYVTSNNTKINKNIKVGDGAGLGNNYYTLEFGEEHFQDLKLTADGTAADDFGRPSNEWSYKNAKIGTYAQTADFVYTAGADGDTKADKVKSMGLKDYKVSKDYYYVNGQDVKFTATTNAGKLEEIADLTANGLKVEAFMDDDNADTIKTFVLTYTQIMQVNAVRSSEVTLKSVEDTYLAGAGTVSAVKDGDDAWNSVKGLKADDYVLVVPVKDGSSYRAFSVTVPQTVTGSLTNVKVKTNNNTVNGVTVAGTAYKMSKLWTSEDKELNATTKLSSSVETTVYLDTYGYVIYAANVTASNSAIIIDEIYSSLVNGKVVKYAKGWDSNGNSIELNLGTSPDLFHHSEADVQGMVFEYATSTANNAEYKLVEPATTWDADASNLVYSYGSTQTVANGTYNMPIVAGGTAKPFDAAVKFIFVSSEGNAVGTDVTGITVKTGVTEITTASNLTYILNKDRNKIVAVVVPNDDDAGNTANLLFFQKVTNHINNADGKRVAIFTAYVNGEKLTDLQLNKDVTNAGYNNKFFTYSKDESTGVYSLTAYNKTGKITSTGSATLAGADLTSAQNYYFKVGAQYLNAKNAVVVDLDTDDGITYSTVKEMKDAIGKDTDANTGNKVTGFDVAYVYNGDSGNTGFRTVSYLFILDTKSTEIGDVQTLTAQSSGAEFFTDKDCTIAATTVRAGTTVYVRSGNVNEVLTSAVVKLTQVTAPDATTKGVYKFVMPKADLAATDITVATAKTLTAQTSNAAFFTDKECTSSASTAYAGATIYVKANTADKALISTNAAVVLTEVTAPKAGVNSVYSFVMPDADLGAGDIIESLKVTVATSTATDAGITATLTEGTWDAAQGDLIELTLTVVAPVGTDAPKTVKVTSTGTGDKFGKPVAAADAITDGVDTVTAGSNVIITTTNDSGVIRVTYTISMLVGSADADLAVVIA